MPKQNVGKIMELEPSKIYVVVSGDGDGGFNFGVIDTLDYEIDDDRFMACLVRGLIATSVAEPDRMVEAGVKAFEQDNAFRGASEVIEKELQEEVRPATPQEINGEDTVIPFPKPQGNA